MKEPPCECGCPLVRHETNYGYARCQDPQCDCPAYLAVMDGGPGVADKETTDDHAREP